MAEDWQKYLKKQDKVNRARLIFAVEYIISDDFSKLDIEVMSGLKNHFRCRVGDFRIIFFKRSDDGFTIKSIGPRGDIYKK